MQRQEEWQGVSQMEGGNSVSGGWNSMCKDLEMG